ncbi:Nif3-like dinuclear metal center hexameric protein [Candidatus Gottesmanbacteria bacterium RIFCSPHIGHO2_02_FULL_39_11]|uniref:Nif3-like dinuclear metal center hexameric protein n=1 Tax=Candidatus Gottesmanbacteria bacterium RIFCSPHIGHO2_02_FULL_39_11 TaxID=1798382 RepID=A0A1F5ZLP3_9BACT|nr:MAG: Nif3-like dinuclear metal center hexameric protein [Candidatus Gottesmanbacteria bacterium RIFCSPHIGHO2_02_FULL_39_11]
MSSRRKSGSNPYKSTMITLFELGNYLSKLLNYPDGPVEKVDPYMANGLMVKGKEEIQKIGFGVSASLELFKKAKEENCDCIITHHSFSLPEYNGYDPIFQSRMEFLIKNNISLFGFHFLLDWHPILGNNAQILKKIGAKPKKPYLFYGNPWGWVGEFGKLKNRDEIEEVLKSFLSPRIITYHFGENQIRKVVAVSGKGAPHASEMKDLIKEKIDLYITGEVHEWNRELFREAKINFIAGGHYHTEVFGLRALMEEVKKKFQIEVTWLKLTNDI